MPESEAPLSFLEVVGCLGRAVSEASDGDSLKYQADLAPDWAHWQDKCRLTDGNNEGASTKEEHCGAQIMVFNISGS